MIAYKLIVFLNCLAWTCILVVAQEEASDSKACGFIGMSFYPSYLGSKDSLLLPIATVHPQSAAPWLRWALFACVFAGALGWDHSCVFRAVPEQNCSLQVG